MSQDPIHIVQVSDIHLFADTSKELLGVNTQNSFAAVVDLLTKDSDKIDIILLSGDLTQDQSPEAYQRVASMLSGFSMPIYYIPGNHDELATMQAVYPKNSIVNDKQIVFPHWQFILLNSQIRKAVPGFLAPSELSYLEACLKMYPQKNAAIVFHHHPLSVNTGWLDPIGLTNANEFWEVVSNYPQVKVVLFGHVHQEFAAKHGDVACYGAPSTCIQFKPNQVEFGLDHIPPGYRRMTLYANGDLTTEVLRCEAYIGNFDEQATGY